MKLFIVMLAVLILASAFFIFEGDYQTYRHIDSAVKRLAEECALSACQFYDPVFYGEGIYVISETEGKKIVEYLIDEANTRFRENREGILTYELELYDSEKGLSGTDSVPESRVTVTYTTEDLFRLPFLRKTEIVRTGSYRMKGY